MRCTLGIDTSNYTTSAALIFSDGGKFSSISEKKLLPVERGQMGLRQSDAVFAHVKQLSEVIKQLMEKAGDKVSLSCVGVSVSPEAREGSYMPCFLTGKMAAESIAAVLNIKCFGFSHQQGHIAAALYSAKALSLVKEEFYAFHVSGGTTELLLVSPSENGLFETTLIGKSLDLKAGQAVDRVGKLLGLSFPAGPELDKLSLECSEDIKAPVFVKETNCSLSGIENKAQKLVYSNADRAYIAKFCLKSIESAMTAMIENAFKKYGRKKILFAGGVMSNTIIRNSFSQKYDDLALFARPEFSSDNAVGAAVLAYLTYGDEYGKQ